MKIRLNLNTRYGGCVKRIINYYSTLESAKKDLAYVEYDSAYYEFSLYDAYIGNENIDYEAFFSQITALPASASAYKIVDGFSWKPPKCECGAETVGSSRHSNWCGKYEKH